MAILGDWVIRFVHQGAADVIKATQDIGNALLNLNTGANMLGQSMTNAMNASAKSASAFSAALAPIAKQIQNISGASLNKTARSLLVTINALTKSLQGISLNHIVAGSQVMLAIFRQIQASMNALASSPVAGAFANVMASVASIGQALGNLPIPALINGVTTLLNLFTRIAAIVPKISLTVLQSGLNAALAFVTQLGRAFQGLTASLNVKQVEDLQGLLGEISKHLNNQKNASLFSGLANGAATLAGSMRSLLGPIEGYTRAGISASYYGDILNIQFAEISRQVASLFVPQIEMAIGAIQSIVTWLRNLTGSQQEGLRNLVLFAAGFTAILTVGARVISVFNTIRTAIMGISAAIYANPIGIAIGAIALVVAGVVSLFTRWDSVLEQIGDTASKIGKIFGKVFGAISNSISNYLKKIEEANKAYDEKMDPEGRLKGMGWEGRDVSASRRRDNWYEGGKDAEALSARKKDQQGVAMAQLHQFSALIANPLNFTNQIDFASRMADGFQTKLAPDKKDQIPLKGGPFEGIESTYKRITMATMKFGGSGKTTQEQQLDLLEKIYETVYKLDGRASNLKPGFKLS
jgi:hypothetical protein